MTAIIHTNDLAVNIQEAQMSATEEAHAQELFDRATSEWTGMLAGDVVLQMGRSVRIHEMY